MTLEAPFIPESCKAELEERELIDEPDEPDERLGEVEEEGTILIVYSPLIPDQAGP